MKFVVGLGVAVGVTIALGGCSGASNSGGDTTCASFVAVSTSDQDATVAKLLKQRNGRNASTADVVDARLRAVQACSADDRRDTPIGQLV